MRIFFIHILVLLLLPVPAYATVMEFNGDGSLTIHHASDYLAHQRHLRKKPPVAAIGKAAQLKDRISEIVRYASEKHGVDLNLIHAVIATESQYNAKAVSPVGAKGLMQLMPATASIYGVTDLFDPQQNIDAGTKHLKYLLILYNNDLNLTLAAYNAGEGNVRKYGGVPPFNETIRYIQKVKANL